MLAIGLLPLLIQGASAQGWAEKMFKRTSHDFRIVGRGTKSQFHFDFTNLYEEDVHVASVRTSCGCTTPTLTKDTLKTHETGSVLATILSMTIGFNAVLLTAFAVYVVGVFALTRIPEPQQS